MGDRFRLIYLKSIGLEKSASDEPSSSHDQEEISKTVPPTPEYNMSGTFSSQVLLKQVNADLEHPDPKVRISAIQYLEKSDPSIALPLLQEMLSDQDPDVRVQALSSLVKFRNRNLISMLKKYLRDRDPRVRMVALRGMFTK